MTEEWKPITIDSRYYISTHGRLKSYCRREPKILKLHLNTSGYFSYALWFNGKSKTMRIHCLVAEVFLGPVPIGMEISHLDGNKKNNRLDNLKYETHAINLARSKGKRPKLNKYKINLMRIAYEADLFNINELAECLNVSPRNVSYALNFKTWKHI